MANAKIAATGEPAIYRNSHNEHEIDSVKSLAEKLEVDVLTLRKFHSISDFDNTFAGSEELIPSNKHFQIPQRNEDKVLIQAPRNPCKNMWNCPTVHWDGTVCSCFMDYDGQRPLGNLHGLSIEDIWFGAAYQELRKRFKRNWRKVSICNECSNGFAGGDIGREANARAYYFNRKFRN